MRKTPALVVAAALLTTMTACTTAAADCASPYPSGTASELVDVSGSVGSAPRVSFPTPLITDGIEVTEDVAGDGETVHAGQIVDLQLSLFLGETGTELTASSYDEAEGIRRTVGDPADVFGSVVECASVGSRVVTTTTVADVYGADTLDPRLGLENDDTLVAVIDVQDAYLGRANGADQLAQPGMPAVVTSPDGVPGLTIPSNEPPTDLKVAVTKKGTGPKVQDGDRVILHYTGVIWSTQEVFQSTWPTKAPVTVIAAPITDEPQAGLPQGWSDALIGQTVGSQVIAVIPPEYGFPEGAAPATIPPGATMVVVFDILGIE
ncbi:MAG: FKBP-type peptidyl-prolyl cis-trans isomerase [Microbacteriaceae bacterium]